MVKKPDRIPAVMASMTPFPWFIHIDDRLARAREVMEEHGIHHLPVTEEGELVGIVTDRDVRLVEDRTAAAERDGLVVRDAATLDAYVVDVGEPLDRVLLEMARRRIDSAIVLKNRKLAGIFTTVDACRSYGEFLRSLFPDGDGDEAA